MAASRSEVPTKRALNRQLSRSASTAAQLRNKSPIGNWLLLVSAAAAALLALGGTAQAARALTAGAPQPFLTLSSLGVGSNLTAAPAFQNISNPNTSGQSSQQTSSLQHATTAGSMDPGVSAMDRQDYTEESEAEESRKASGR
jgi:hypothetical protein